MDPATSLSLGDTLLGLAPLAGVFLAVMAAVYGIAGLVGKDPLGRRVRMAAGDSTAGEAAANGYGSAPADRIARALKRYEKYLTPGKSEELSRLQLHMVRAGYTHPAAPTLYMVSRVVLAFGLMMLAGLSLPFIGLGGDAMMIGLMVGMAGAIGFYGPVYWVHRLVKQRQEDARIGFPDALDLMLVCVEAGMGLDSAIARIAEELRHAHPVLALHLGAASLEMRAGRPREQAMRSFAERTGVEEITAFAVLLIQSQELGTSVGDTLRVFANEMRVKRMLRAEEKAAKLPVKMVLPMSTLLLPAMLVIVMYPALVRIVETFAILGDSMN